MDTRSLAWMWVCLSVSKWIGHSRNDVWLSGLGYKRHGCSSLFSSLTAHSEDPPCCSETLKQSWTSYGTKLRVLPITGTSFPAMSVSLLQAHPPAAVMFMVLADHLIATLWKTQKQNFPAKLLLISWATANAMRGYMIIVA